MKSLCDQLKDTRSAYERDRARMISIRTDPRDAHDAEQRVHRGKREIKRLEEAIDENRALAARIRELLSELDGSDHKSRHRSITYTHLEEALIRLKHETED